MPQSVDLSGIEARVTALEYDLAMARECNTAMAFIGLNHGHELRDLINNSKITFVAEPTFQKHSLLNGQSLTQVSDQGRLWQIALDSCQDYVDTGLMAELETYLFAFNLNKDNGRASRPEDESNAVHGFTDSAGDWR